MNDKPVDPIFMKMDQLLAQMQRSIEEVRTALFVMAQIPPDDMIKHEERARKSNLVHQVMTGLIGGSLPGRLMSGRWHRRDGDSYGVIRQPGVPRPDADDPTGNIRPADERGD